MNINVPELQDERRYRLLYELHHDELIKFVQSNIKKANAVTVSYFVFNAFVLALTADKIYTDIAYRSQGWDRIISGLGLGFFLTFLVGFLIHENIHLLAYKILGARQATIRIIWRKAIFLALADKFVLSRREFYFLALLPFFIITTVLLVLLPFSSTSLSYLVLGILLLHTGGCSGDFSLVSYFYANRDRAIIVYDDVPENKTFFYEIIER